MECKNCCAELHRGLAVCPQCGARQRHQPDKIRCRYCKSRVSSYYRVCPNCGRELQAAGISWSWLAGGGVAAIVVAGILFGRIPSPSAISQRISQAAQTLSAERLPTDRVLIPASTATQTSTRTAAPTRTPTSIPSPTSTPTLITGTVAALQATAEPTNASATQPAATPAPTSTPSVAPTSVPPTETSAPPTAPPPAPPPAQPQVQTYVVRAGDTPLGIALRFGISLNALYAANPEVANGRLGIGQVVKIPVAGSEAAPAAPSAPQPQQYTIRLGDTWWGLANRFGVSVDQLQALNNYNTNLQPGMVIKVPAQRSDAQPPAPVEVAIAPTATVQPTAAPTDVPATPAPALAVGDPGKVADAGAITGAGVGGPGADIVYPAPRPVGPSDNSSYLDENTEILLRWEAVSLTNADEWYMVTLTWRQGGVDVIENVRTRESVWRVPKRLFKLADQSERTYRWSVSLVRATGDNGVIARSPASEARKFTWR